VTGLVAALTMTVGRDGDAELAARLTDLARSDTVVDIGCGPGNAARMAAARGAIVIGVDPAAVMLRVARKLSRNAPHLSFVRGAAERIPVDDAAASVAWSLAAVHHWPNLDAGLREVQRVLRPGGRFVAIETQNVSHGWTDDQAERFAALCRDHGFTDVGIERRTADRRPRVAVFASRARANGNRTCSDTGQPSRSK